MATEDKRYTIVMKSRDILLVEWLGAGCVRGTADGNTIGSAALPHLRGLACLQRRPRSV